MAVISTKSPGVTREATESLAGLMSAADKADKNAQDLLDDIILETLKLDFANGIYRRYTAVSSDNYALQDIAISDLATLLNFARSSIGTYFDALGILRTAASGELRWDHDPITGECKGLLIEESRTNLLLQSEGFSLSDWNKSDLTISSNATTAPDDNTTADKLVEDSTDNVRYISHGTNVAVTVGNFYTLCVFAKADERHILKLLFGTSEDVEGGYANFDLSSGSILNNGFSSDRVQIEPLQNGYYRCSVVIEAAESNIRPFLMMQASDTSGRFVSYQGDGSSGFYLWGAQLEEGTFPTSYTPTTSAQVTRSADEASITGTDFSDFYNQDEGTVVCDFYFNGIGNHYERTYSIEDGTSNNFISLFVITDDLLDTVKDGGTKLIQERVIEPVQLDTLYKYALGISTSNGSCSINGILKYSDLTTGSLPLVDRMYIGRDINVSHTMCGHIKSLTYYPRRLTNDQLQALTR